MGLSRNLLQVIQEIEFRLRDYYTNPTLANQTAWWLIQAVTHVSKAHLITDKEFILTSAQQSQLNEWLDQLTVKDKPLAYILGSIPFGNVTITTTPPTLIPRPETEEWVYHIISQLQLLNNQSLSILDVCTGSGCIAIALAHALPKAHIIATDISPDALQLAKKNAAANKCTNITFLESDLFKNISQENQFDIIVSNPPYISEDEWRTLDTSVRKWEDKKALVAENNGYEIIETIIQQAPDYIKNNPELKERKIPQLLIEVGYNQTATGADMMQESGYTQVNIKKDLEGKERVITARVA